MYDLCPHCAQTIEQEQVVGRMLVCGRCGKDIGFVGTVQRADVNETDELIRSGAAVRCPTCGQAIEVKTSKDATRFAPHYGSAQTKKICPASGKPVPSVPKRSAVPENLSAHMTRDVIKMISCQRGGEPRIEIITLEYLDKRERVRIQIEALREMLGPDFRMKDYPPSLSKPQLAVWVATTMCVIAQKHELGGYASIADTEMAAVLEDLRSHRQWFFDV